MLINSGNLIPTPARQYFHYFTWASEYPWTQKIIIEQKNDLKAVVITRKTCLNDKTKVINEYSLILTVEKLIEIQKAEKVTRERGIKRQKLSKKSCSNMMVELNDDMK